MPSTPTRLTLARHSPYASPVNASVSSRQVLGQRTEAAKTRKLGRTSGLYNDFDGMLSSQLGETQWAVNMGLEESQFSTIGPSSEAKPTTVKDENHTGLPENWHKLFTFSPSPTSSPTPTELRVSDWKPLLPINNIRTPQSTTVKSLIHTPAWVKSELPEIKPKPALTDTFVTPVHAQAPVKSEPPLVEAEHLLSKRVAIKVNSDIVLSAGEKEIIYKIRELSRKGEMEMQDEMDLLRLEYSGKLRYIRVLEACLIEAGLDIPEEPLIESQKGSLRY
ncbi:hypothetical protein K435DRAFT_869973 [Dendrothele bispora CBS 962.96]|uniref:Uncharacterized protein n=1 Tax=Dendrothele bispora (strain CBS 962.96) TaxID=1314807 RepID=A0A4S8L886_DENBC|nr:hypothetical protein K435DRAFT_869973 [Dendrothele bispora CBS 962.96]